MARFIYVDNSNLWIEGQRLAAVKSKLSRNIVEAMNNDIVDYGWKYDFGELHRLTCPPGQEIGRLALFGSTPPPNDSLWRLAEQKGFEVVCWV